jgi:predicted transposase YdaD
VLTVWVVLEKGREGGREEGREEGREGGKGVCQNNQEKGRNAPKQGLPPKSMNE